MNRITCEVCGTAFQDTSACCPICGWRPDGGSAEPAVDPAELETFDLDDLTKDLGSEPAGKKGGKRVFDFDAVNTEKNASVSAEDDDDYYASAPEDQEPQKSNTALVVVLVIFIALVLCATAFLAIKFLIPGKKAENTPTTVPTVAAETVATTEALETEAPTVPCTGLAMPSGVSDLTSEGQLYLLHVVVTPEDTTDTLEYRSEDESVVTVSPEGCLTAVGNGTTNVVITCGDQTLTCAVTVAIAEETTEATTEATAAAETTEATEAATEATTGSTTLKLKKTDITFGRVGVYTTLELDCDLKAEDVKWRTSDSSIAMVRNGVVTAMGKGVAKITATYNGESVSCIVRVK